jgi:ABC-type bacteriocin/lantibiotic exporter with double-glycine peptidase domain
MQRIRLLNISDQAQRNVEMQLLSSVDVSKAKTQKTKVADLDISKLKTQEMKAPHGKVVPMHARRPRRSLLRKLWRRRVPQLTQMSMVECGVASLAMVLSYYGRKTSVSEVGNKWKVGRDGLSGRALVQVARSYGMRVRPVSLPNSDFRFVKLPAIIHWEFNHFIVVERWSPKWVDVVDPALGRRRLTSKEFDEGFTGVVIILEPGAHFDRHSSSARASIGTYLFQYIQHAPATALQVLVTSILLQLFGLFLPLLTKVVIDQVLPFRIANVMILLGVGILMLLLMQAVATLLREWSLVYLQARTDMHMMLNFCEHLFMLPYSFFQQRSSGDLLARLSSNTVIRDILSNQLISTLLDGGTVTIYLIILLWQSPPFAVLTLLIGLLQVILLLVSYRPISNLTSRELAAQGISQGYLTEALAGIGTLKAAGAEHQALDRWSNLYFEQVNLSARHRYFSATIGTALATLRSLAPLALLWMGTLQALNGSLSIGTMLALTALAAGFLAPLNSLVSSGQQLQTVQAHLERIADVTMAKPEQDRETVQQPPKLTGSIRVENVSFQYAADGEKVLRGINLTVMAGQKVAIVGTTGSGKSTLGKLLLGLYTPTEGSILYDGIPLQNLDYQQVRRQFGAVMQDSSIFSGTVLQNVAFNDPAMENAQVVSAAQAAAIHEDIMQWPMGYETYVAEGGSALSGGQRQRLALARAIASRPAILLLDEATSHLDVVTEQRVEENLHNLACTQIIIAHRLSTIRNADIILVMDRGSIVERGTHSQLLEQNGYYARLIKQQMENRTSKIA